MGSKPFWIRPEPLEIRSEPFVIRQSTYNYMSASVVEACIDV